MPDLGYYTFSYHWSIPVGRLLCSTSEEVERYTRKLMLYEANPGYGKNDYLGKALFFESCNTHYYKGEGYHSNCFITNKESKSVRLACDSVFDIVFIQDPTHKTKYNEEMDPTSLKPENGPTGTEIVQWIGKTGFSSWFGHGSPYGVICSDVSRVLYTDDSRADKYPYETPNAYKNTPGSGLTNLTNRDYPAIVYSISCDNAPFDELVWVKDSVVNRLSEMNLGATFTTGGDYGGPAAIMNTRSGKPTVSVKTEVLFIKALLHNSQTIGLAHCISKQNTEYAYTRANLNLIGEPEFEMWLGKPKTLDINIEENAEGFYLSGTDLDSVRLVLSNSDRAYRNYPVGNVNAGAYLNGLVGG